MTARGVEAELRRAKSRVVLVAVDGPDVVGYANIYRPDPAEQAPRVTDHRPRGARVAAARDRERAARAGLLRAPPRPARHDCWSWSAMTTSRRDSPTRRGFTIGRRMSHSKAELSAAPRAGRGTVRASALPTTSQVDPRQLYLAEAAVRDDDPSGLSGGSGVRRVAGKCLEPSGPAARSQ
jgi:hypothetical protein